MGWKYKNSSWHLNGFPYGGGSNIGSTVCFLDVAMVWKGKPASVTTGSRDRTYVRK